MITLAADLLRSRRVLIGSICAALLFVSIGYLALYPSFEGQIQTLADDLPDAYKAFIGDADIGTPEGYIRSQVYSLFAPLLTAGAAIAAGSSLAKAERDQTLAVLTVTPLSRRALAGSWVTLVVSVAFMAAVAVVVGVVIGGPLAGASVGVDRVVLATVPVFVFALLIGGIALLVSAFSGAPGAATGAGWGAIVVSFLANSLAELIDGLSWLSNISPWSWHGSGAAITDDLDVASLGLLAAASVGVVVIAVARFDRRNLHF